MRTDRSTNTEADAGAFERAHGDDGERSGWDEISPDDMRPAPRAELPPAWQKFFDDWEDHMQTIHQEGN